MSIGTRDGMAHGAPGMQEMPRYFRALQLQRLMSRMSLDAAGMNFENRQPSLHVLLGEKPRRIMRLRRDDLGHRRIERHRQS